MEKSSNAPRSLILSLRLYQVLLAIYPSEFRREYGGPMLQAFGDCCRRAFTEAGLPGLLALWARTLLDTVQTALEEHTQRGVDMSKEKFFKLSGWALMLGGFSMLLAWLASSRPDYNPYNARSLTIDRYANAVEGPLMVISLFLLGVGIAGLFLRYGQASGLFGRFSLGLSAISGTASVVGALGLGIYDNETWWTIFFIGLLLEFLGLALFGLANLRQRSLPRWNGIPVLAGMWLPLYVLAGLLIEQGSGNWVEFPPAVDLGFWLVTTASLFTLGYLLQSDVRPVGAAVLQA